MEIEIVDLKKDGTDTIVIAKIPSELEDVPPLPGKEHEEEWEEFWTHKKEAAKVHLGTAILIQTELTDEEIKNEEVK